MAKLSSTDIYGDLYVDGIISGILNGSVSNNLIVKLNGGTTEGTNHFTFNGSSAKTIDITASNVGALSTSGGAMTGRLAITTSSTTSDANQPTQLVYGMLASYGNLKLLGNTDESNGNNNEYVHIAAAQGLTPGTDKGIVVYGSYANCFGGTIYTTNNKPTAADIGAAPVNHSHQYFSGGGTSGTSGYVAFAQLKITGAYTNRPIEFKLICRGKMTSSTVTVTFNNANSTDPSLWGIRYWGTDYGVFIHKADVSTWVLYHTKSESYDSVTVVESNQAPQGITVTYPGTFITERPSSNTTNATLGGNIGNANTVGGYSVWVGSQASYNSLTKNATTVYFITG